MARKATQVKKGYLRGVKGVLVIPLNNDGSKPSVVVPEKYWIDTSQEVSVEAEIVEGDSDELRGGDQLLVRMEGEDVVVGANLGFTDARFDAIATEIIAGGTLIISTDDPTEIIGWESPTILEQHDRPPFEAEVYVQSFGSAGGREAYLRYTFRYCRGSAPNVTHSDQEWGTPEFSIKARENPATGESTYKKEFVPVLPPKVPEDVSIVAGSGKVDLSWSAAVGAESYNVYQYKGSNAPEDPEDWESAEEGIEGLEVSISGLDSGEDYVFAVTAVNASGESGLSAITEAVGPK